MSSSRWRPATDGPAVRPDQLRRLGDSTAVADTSLVADGRGPVLVGIGDLARLDEHAPLTDLGSIPHVDLPSRGRDPQPRHATGVIAVSDADALDLGQLSRDALQKGAEPVGAGEQRPAQHPALHGASSTGSTSPSSSGPSSSGSSSTGSSSSGPSSTGSTSTASAGSVSWVAFSTGAARISRSTSEGLVAPADEGGQVAAVPLAGVPPGVAAGGRFPLADDQG